MRPLITASRLAAAAALALVASLALPAGPALAGGGDDTYTPDPGSGNGGIGAGGEGSSGGETSTPGSGGSGTSPYKWCITHTLPAGGTVYDLLVFPGEPGMSISFSGVSADQPSTEEQEFSICYNADTNTAYIAPVGEGIDPQVIIDNLVDQAYRRVALPHPTPSSSPAGDAEAPLITQLATLLWLDPGIWAPVSVSAGPVFGFTVTVTAEPAEVTFSGGDDSVTCTANGVGGTNTDCALTFRHSSATGPQTLSAAMDWDVSWVCEPGCGGGDLAGLSLTDTDPVLVAELEAVGQSS